MGSLGEMTEHDDRRREYPAPSWSPRPPATVYRTRARRRREAFLATTLSLVALVVLAGLGGLVWYVIGTVDGGDESTEATPADSEVSAAVVVDYQIEPLVDLVALRDAAYVPVKAFHVTSDKANDKASMGRIMDLIDRTEINSLVIEVKDEYGRVAFDSDAPMAVESDTVKPIIWGGDLDALINTLTERGITPIARVVCFKDNRFTQKRPDLALLDENTRRPWEDYKGNRYLNPYKHETWEYIVQVAEDAAKRGFREIQFDYVRFPDGASGDLSTISYPGQYGTKEEAIAGFLAYAKPRLEALGVWVSADVFGWIMEDGVVSGIGQDFDMMSRNLDLVCPMVYPDHYPLGYGGIAYPPAQPYKTISRALRNAPEMVDGIGVKCRPYLQAHTDIQAQHIKYTAELVKEEIRAAADLGIDEYVLWAGYPDLGSE